MKPINVIRTLAFAILGGYGFVLPAQAIGLDCYKATSKVERLICDEKKNPGLYSLDSTLNMLYDEARERVEGTKTRDFVEEQKKWLKNVRNACDSANCLRDVYKTRIGEIQEVATLCRPQEIVIFSCSLPARKVVSLCGSSDAGLDTGYMQFRLGPDQKSIELDYPQERSPAKNHFQSLTGGDYRETSAASIWAGQERYIVFITRARQEADYHTGVVVSHGHPPKLVSYSECIREPVVFGQVIQGYTINIDSLAKTLGLPDGGEEISSAIYEVE
jgi:uncharacterized protein